MPSSSMPAWADGNIGLGHGGESDETADFDHIRKDAVMCTSQCRDSLDDQQVGTDALNVGTHPR